MADKKIKEAQIKIENKTTEIRMYLGPAVKKYGIQSGTVYRGELPANVKEAIKEYKELEMLFVNVNEKLAIKKLNLKQSGTKENISYKTLLKKLGGK